MSNLYLSGFMGVGKTTLGRLLAQSLGIPFQDTDLMIEDRLKKKIPEIFATEGEEGFRRYEERVILDFRNDFSNNLSQEVLTKKACDATSFATASESRVGHPFTQVVALGGGAILKLSNRESLMASGTLVYLRARPDTLLSRLTRGNKGLRAGLEQGLEEELEEELEEVLGGENPQVSSHERPVETGPRPLFQGLPQDEWLGRINSLLEARRPLYEEADWIFDTDGKLAAEVLNEILTHLRTLF